MRIAVTGGSGKLGQATRAALNAAGHEAINLDITPPSDGSRFVRIDFTDYGQVVDAFSSIDSYYDRLDGIIHLANIPGPSRAGKAAIYANNAVSSFNVFQAARLAGIKNIVWASSETLLGFPLTEPPDRVPVDEDSPRRPGSAYALAKLGDENLAAEFCRWDPDLKMIGLRYSNVLAESDYAAVPGFQNDPRIRSWNLWSYIDARDGAEAARLAIEHDATGLDIFLLANADTLMERPTVELLDEVYPDVPRTRPIDGHQGLMSIEKARRVLGWEPRHTWRAQGA